MRLFAEVTGTILFLGLVVFALIGVSTVITGYRCVS